jgi:hypothetical protein
LDPSIFHLYNRAIVTVEYAKIPRRPGWAGVSRLYNERSSTLVTSNLPFAEWTEVFGSERLTGALLERLTHHVHILEMNGDSFRLEHSRKKNDATAEVPAR